MVRPRLSYLICATPRSGSTLLGEALAATGVAGRPDEHFEVLRHSGLPREPREYFEGVEDAGVLALLPETDPGRAETEDFEDRLAAVLERGTTANGIFGAKVMWGHLADLAARAGDERAGADVLAALFPGARYVHVSRTDTVAQAVSLWRAVQTRAWRAEDDDGDTDAATYHLAGIDHLVAQLAAQDRAWRAVVRPQGDRPAGRHLRGARGGSRGHAARRAQLRRRAGVRRARTAAAPPGRRALGRVGAPLPRRAPGAGARMSRIALDPHEPLSQLRALEAESVHVMREVAAEFERPVLLFSGGKDSIVLLRLAEKAFRPGAFPFPVMHVDTGHNFAEVLEFRDRRLDELGERLIVASVQDSIDRGRAREETGPDASRNRLQTVTLLDAIEAHGFDAAFGGARRDEERARAKERVFSFRDEDFGQWDPRAQRPEVWGLYNTRIHRGEHVRVFPLSNWTELDVWRYIEAEGLELPSIYFAHTGTVFERDGLLLAASEHLTRREERRSSRPRCATGPSAT